MAGKKQTPKPKVASTPSSSGKEKTGNPEPTTSSSSVREGSSRRKQKNPTRTLNYTNLLVYGKRFKVSLKMCKEIQKLQTVTSLVIPRLPFARVVREILNEYGYQFRVQSSTMEALQLAAEMYMHQFFEDSNLCAFHAKRITLFPRDMQLVHKLRRDDFA